jgi:Protein of unknown function (DUF433)
MTEALLQRISLNPEICHGRPCIRGLRYPVEFLLELLSSGMTHEEILALLIMGMIFGSGRFANALCDQSRELTSQRKRSAIHTCIQQHRNFDRL